MSERSQTRALFDRFKELPLKAKVAIPVGVVALPLAVLNGIDTDSSKSKIPEQLTSFEACENEPQVDSAKILVDTDDDSNDDETVGGFYLKHIVKESDMSLSAIASCYFPNPQLGVSSILASNPNIKNPDVIRPGQELKIWITDPETRLSSKDRSVKQVASLTGFDKQVLAIINRASNRDSIKSGTPIVLPRQQRMLQGEQSYVVNAGDSYSQIADELNADVVLLQTSNPMDAAHLQPGQIVVVPSGNRGELSTEDQVKRSGQADKKHRAPSAELPPEEQLRDFIDIYGAYAKKVQDKYGIPEALVLATAYHESEYGRSELAMKANNFHGLKANEGWDGGSYKKKTEEFYDAKQLAKAKAEGKTIELIDENDGEYHIYVIDAFRRYNSVEDGFMGYGEKLSSEGNYPDAFETDDPYKFLNRLVDDNGPKFATDPEYYSVVSDKIRRVEQVLYRERVMPTPAAPHTELEDSAKKNLEAVKLSVKGYEKFKDSIDTSYLKKASEYKTYNPDTNGVPQEDSELFLWHFTTLYYNGAGKSINQPIGDSADVEHFLTSTNGSGVGIQWFIDRSGQTYQLTDTSTRTSHIPPHSSVSTGVEVESDTQDNITPAQYESAAYLAAYNIIKLDLLAGDKSIDEVLYGHGELREIDRLTDRSLNVRSDFPAAESLELRKKVRKLLSDLDY